MGERGGQRAEGLTKEPADGVGRPNGGPGKAIDGAGGIGIAAAQDGALDEDGALGLGKTIEPAAQTAATGARDEVGEVLGRERGGVFVETGRGCIAAGHLGEAGGILVMHEGEGSVEDAVAYQAFDSRRVGAGIDVDSGDGGFDEAEGFGFVAQQESGDSPRFERGKFGALNGVRRKIGTRAAGHEGTSKEPGASIVAEGEGNVKWRMYREIQQDFADCLHGG